MKTLTVGAEAPDFELPDEYGTPTRAGAQRVGISADPVAKQQEFSVAYDLDYPLLSDPGRVISEVVASELSMEVHTDAALGSLNAL